MESPIQSDPPSGLFVLGGWHSLNSEPIDARQVFGDLNASDASTLSTHTRIRKRDSNAGPSAMARQLGEKPSTWFLFPIHLPEAHRARVTSVADKYRETAQQGIAADGLVALRRRSGARS